MTLFVPVKIELLEKEEQRKKHGNNVELITSAPQPRRAFPNRQMSQSPDFQMEELLTRDGSAKDEVSEKYLSINSRYITDGQGVVPGILLITPQTMMFNPCVSDHLVIDRGREAYLVRAPLKAIGKILYYKDVAAMVLGNTAAEFIIPESSFEQDNKLSRTKCDSMDTSNYVSQNTAEMLSDTNISGTGTINKTENSMKEGNTIESCTKEDVFDGRDHDVDVTPDQHMSQDTTCGDCSEMSLEATKSQESNMSLDQTRESSDTSSKTVELEENISSDVRMKFTNHDTKNKPAEITRDGIDTMDTECTSTPRKIIETQTPRLSKAKNYREDDSGFIYTKVKSKDTVQLLTGNSVKLEQDKFDGTKRNNGKRTGNIDSKKEIDLFCEDESAAFIDASRDSGISEGSSLQTNSSRATSRQRSHEHKPLSPRSSLSTEARLWLGRRGIHMSNESDDSEESYEAETFDASHEDLVTPRPAAATADELVYLCLKIRRSYWCRPSARTSHIMGIPPNRDQQRMEHWFAVPTNRVNQIHSFLKSGAFGKDFDNENEESIDRSADGLSIVDDTFSRPIVKETQLKSSIYDHTCIDVDTYKHLHNLGPGSISRKSTASSLNEDDQPELTEDSNILDKSQIAILSRELPSRTVGHRWDLVYSTAVHGISLKTLYRNTLSLETPILLVVADQEGKTFGAFMSDAPRISEGFYGTGESMLFSLEDNKQVKVYRWSGINTFFIKGDSRCLAIGGGDGLFGLWLDEDLYHGRSHSCKTFNNETLSSKEDFICRGLEAWAFG